MKYTKETIYAVSETTVPTLVEQETPVAVTEPSVQAVVRVGEIVELREENCKVFQMSDGTQQAVYFAEPVHVFNEETQTYEELAAAQTMAVMNRAVSVAEGTSAMSTYSWESGEMSSAAQHKVGRSNTAEGACATNRMYISLNIPTLPRNPRIKKAELTFFQANDALNDIQAARLGLYCTDNDIFIGTCTPQTDTTLIDYAQVQHGGSEDGDVVNYTFDVTTLMDAVIKGETPSSGLVLQMIDETCDGDNYVTICGSACGESCAPQLVVTYESSYGVNTSYRTHTHQLGRFGQGSVDLQCGNLMFESEDFAWAGNRMPVTIKHLYNSALYNYRFSGNTAIKLNTADFTAMNVGYGFKLNLMQSMIATTFFHEGVSCNGYVFMGENSEEIYFKQSEENAALFEAVDGSELVYDSANKTLTQGEEVYLFDDQGRLIRITDSNGNHMDITYTEGKITLVTDGAGRTFTFAYDSSDRLIAITAPDSTQICYTYEGSLLKTVTYQDGKKAQINYSGNKPVAVILKDVLGAAKYRVTYTYTGDRLTKVEEYGIENGTYVTGVSSVYSYSAASGRTIVQTTEHMDADEGESANNTVKTVYTFNDDGDIISEYAYTEDTGNTGVEGEESGIHPHSGDGGVNTVSNCVNLLKGHNFEAEGDWLAMANNTDENMYIHCYAHEPYAKFGKTVLRMESKTASAAQKGVYQTTASLPAGQYTFSAYLRVIAALTGVTAPGAYLRVVASDGTVLAQSERICRKDSQYIRLCAPFTVTTAQAVQVQILMDGTGTVYVDAAQLENNPFASAYNLLENGSFETTAKWAGYSAAYSAAEKFNLNRSITMNGNLVQKCYVAQDVIVHKKQSTRETFTLSGWAKGISLPNHARTDLNDSTFRLYATLYYTDNTTETFNADFCPSTEEWQFASIQFAKSKFLGVAKIRVGCEFGYNAGKVYFDNVQLVRDFLEKDLTAADFVVDAETEEDAEVVSETDEGAIAEDIAPAFEEAKDTYGNAITETTFTEGEFGTIYRAFGYDAAGNDLVSEIDPRGYTTSYTVDAATSRNEEITDRCGNKTAYEYDAAGRTAKVTSKNASGTELANVSYAYDAFDNLTEIVRGDGMKYVLAYNAFHNLESIGIDGKDESLVHYDYKTGNGRLKAITYANGDKMKVTYNSAGQMTAEKWFDAEDNLTAHYKYTYDSQGNIVRSVDMLAQKEYTYTYEEGKLVRAAQCDITLDDSGFTVSRTLENTVFYIYGEEDKLIRKRIVPAGGAERVIYYETAADDGTVMKCAAGAYTVTSHSKTDSFGRKVFDELQLQKGFVSRQFRYHAGDEPEQHRDSGKLRSSATTQLVSQILLSDGRTISYEYDKEERITKVIDSVDGTTVYTYDALGQLLTEKVDGTTVNTMTYDRYGNIQTKNGVTYTYGNDAWKDLLTGYGTQTISYDAQGNPTSYLGHTLAWEKGRQLKSFDSNAYTYNANGIRTGKTVDGVRHDYLLESTRILQETWGGNTLIPLYDNEDAVCGIIYNNAAYYFQKNLQGDIIALTNHYGAVQVRYTYDAWGVPTVSFDITPAQIGSINPFRYRGYYYDPEIGMYYLQSRYYDPTVGRFINADEAMLLAIGGGKLGHNLFHYCENNPANQKDTNGNIAANIVGAAIGAIIGVVGGVFLGNWLADVLKLSGWKRGVFVAAVAALVGAAAGAIGYFIGPYVAKIAAKLGKYIANLVRKGKIAFKRMSSKVKSSLRTLFKETCCFVAGTQVSTPTGEKSIERITVGDRVYAANPETGEFGIKKVSRVFAKQTHTLYHVITSNEKIVTTAEHPFWVNGKGWVAACNLCQRDTLHLQSKGTVEIIDVFIEKLDVPVTVYNFEVEGWHTYFVGSDRILVHNKCSLTKIKDSYLKQKGFDAHAIKKEFVSKNNISKYDMYYDKDSGLIFLLRKGAKAVEAIATGYFIK